MLLYPIPHNSEESLYFNHFLSPHLLTTSCICVCVTISQSSYYRHITLEAMSVSGSESFGFGERYYHSLCPVSLAVRDTGDPGAGVSCPRCDMVWYTDLACLESHQPTHAPLCGLISKLKLVAGGRNPLDKSPGSCLQVANIAKMLLKRSLTQAESDMLMFPRTCATCSAFLASERSVVTECAGCLVYCDQECRDRDKVNTEHHEQILANREDYLHTRRAGALTDIADLDLANINRIPDTMEEALQMLDPSLSLDTPRGRHVSSQLSSPLTCLMAAARHLPSPSPRLTVHCVGSRKIETASAWSLLPSLMPGVEKVTIVFIGLECVQPPEDDSHHPCMELIYQPPCPYDEYARSPDYREPDLVCALNCGFILYSSWAASIPLMIRDSGAPLVFTEYYDIDARANLDLVTQLCEVKTVEEVKLNPFRSGLAQRSPRVMWGAASGGRAPVIADNNHLAVVTRLS